MNFLAHALLSGDDDAVLVGNVCADFIKGVRLDDVPDGIRDGVRMHRRIDRELSGWRRLQWPVIGLFFAGLGVATLMGWR